MNLDVATGSGRDEFAMLTLVGVATRLLLPVDVEGPQRRRQESTRGAPARELARWSLQDHLSVTEIARRLGCSDHWVRTALIRAEIPFRRRSVPPVPELARLYIEDRLSTREIAHRYGVSQAKVWRALGDNGIARRPGPAVPITGTLPRSVG